MGQAPSTTSTPTAATGSTWPGCSSPAPWRNHARAADGDGRPGAARPEMEHACQNVTLRFVVGGSLVAVQPIGPDSLPEPAGPAAGAAGSGRTGAALIRPRRGHWLEA